MNVRKKVLTVSRRSPIHLEESLTRHALKEQETMKHIVRRLLLAVMLAVVVVMPGLLYPASAGAADTLDQSQTVSQSRQTVHNTIQRAQIFTAGMYGSLDRVSLRLENYVPSPPAGAVLNVSIQTVVDGLPSGTQIGSGTIPLSAIPAYGSGGNWVDVTISGAVAHAGTQYAIVLQTSLWNATVFWWYAAENAYGSNYAGGDAANNYGDGWVTWEGYDFTFQTYVLPGPDQSQTMDQFPATVSFGTQQAQIFTAGIYGTLDWVSLYLENSSDLISAGYLTISVQTVIGGLPSGEEIGRGTIPISAIPPPGSAGWVDVPITDAVVRGGTQYALVLRTTTLRDVVNWWYAENTGYTGGEMASNYGDGWVTEEAYDFAFQTYVTPDVLDQSAQASNTCLYNEGNMHQFAQTFTARVSGVIDRVAVAIETFGYFPSDTVDVSIQTLDRGDPSGKRIGSGTIPADYSWGWTNVDISDAVVTAGHNYAIVLNAPNFCWIKSGDNYNGGELMYRWEEWLPIWGHRVFWNDVYYPYYPDKADGAFQTYVATPAPSAPSTPPAATITPCSSGVCPAVSGSVTPNDSTARVTSNVQFRELPDGTVKGVLNFNDSKTGDFVLQGCTTGSAACRLTVTTFACTDQDTITVAGTYTPKGGTAADYLLTLSGVKDEVGTFTLTSGDYTYTVTHEGIVDVICP